MRVAVLPVHWLALAISLLGLILQFLVSGAPLLSIVWVLSIVMWSLTVGCLVRQQRALSQSQERTLERLHEEVSGRVQAEMECLCADHVEGTTAGDTLSETPDIAVTETLRKLTVDLLHTMHAEILVMHTELDQIRDIVGDAMGKLHDSFHGLNHHTQLQRDVILYLIQNINTSETTADAEHISIQSFIGTVSQTLEYFVDLLVTTSQQSMQIVHQMDDVGSKWTRSLRCRAIL